MNRDAPSRGPPPATPKLDAAPRRVALDRTSRSRAVEAHQRLEIRGQGRNHALGTLDPARIPGETADIAAIEAQVGQGAVAEEAELAGDLLAGLNAARGIDDGGAGPGEGLAFGGRGG